MGQRRTSKKKKRIDVGQNYTPSLCPSWTPIEDLMLGLDIRTRLGLDVGCNICLELHGISKSVTDMLISFVGRLDEPCGK